MKPPACRRNFASLAFQSIPQFIAKVLSGLVSFVFSRVSFLSPEGGFDGGILVAACFIILHTVFACVLSEI